MAKKMTMYSAAKMLVAVLMITNLTTRCSTTPVGPPTIAEPNSPGNVAAENNEELKISTKALITKYAAVDPKIGDKAVNPIELEKIKDKMDRIEKRMRDHLFLLCQIVFIFGGLGIFSFFQTIGVYVETLKERCGKDHFETSLYVSVDKPLAPAVVQKI